MKKFVLHFVYLFAVCFVLFSCSKDDSNEAQEIENTVPLEAFNSLNISYGDHPQQVYDIYLPAGRTADKTKVLVLVHGGGWTEGDKTDMTNYVIALQELHPNYGIVNINYVLATLTTPAFPNQFLDVQKVLDQLIDQQNELQIKPEFGLVGVSAGAHIALMYDSVYDTDNDFVKFVADVVGPSDFTDPFYADDPGFPLALTLLVDEDEYPAGTNYAEATSPAFNINNKTSPSLLFYGNQDPLVPLTNGNKLATAFSNAQRSHQFTVYNGGHGDDWSPADRVNLQNQISDYINEYLSIE